MAQQHTYPELPSVKEQFHKQERNLQTRELTQQEKFESVTEAHQLVSTLAARSHLVIAYGALWITAGILLIKFTTPTIGLFSLVFLALPLIGLLQLGIYVFFRVLLHQWKTKVFIMENGSAVHRYDSIHGRSGILRFSKSK